MKMETIPGKHHAQTDDPRSLEYRNLVGYESHVRNEVTNYCTTFRRNLTYRYMVPKGDWQLISHDHDYLQRPLTEHFVDTAVQVQKILYLLLSKLLCYNLEYISIRSVTH